MFLLVFILNTFYSHAHDFENFFPKGSFGNKKVVEDLVQNWYGKHLASMEEPILFRKASGKVYRFTWLRSFDSPMVFRISKNRKNSFKLVVKKTDGHGGYEAGEIIFNKDIQLTNSQSGPLLGKIEKECEFWKMPSQINEDGHDGAQWILEGIKEGKYHMVDRQSPVKGCMYEIGKMFMDLSGVQIDNVY